MQAKRVTLRPAAAISLLLGAQLAVGAAAIFARYALTGSSALTASALRLAIAAAVIAGVTAVRRERVALGGRERLLLALAGAALALHFATWIGSLAYTSVAIATLLVCSSPIFTALYELVTHARRPSARFFIALGAGFAGLLLVVAHRAAPAPVAGHVTLGNLLALGGGIAIAAYLLIVRHLRRSQSTLTIVSQTYAWAAGLLLVAATFAGGLQVTGSRAWLGIIAMALISQLLGHTALNAVLRSFRSSVVGFATLLEPVFAALLAALLFAESIGGTTVAGGIVILGAVALLLSEDATYCSSG